MSQRLASELAKHHPDKRRASLATPLQASSALAPATATAEAKEGKRSLVAVLSEDHMGSKSSPSGAGGNLISSLQKQSFLSRLARSETKLPKNADKVATVELEGQTSRRNEDKMDRLQESCNDNNNNNNNGTDVVQASSLTQQSRQCTLARTNETECDKVLASTNTNNNNSNNKLPTSRASKSFSELDTKSTTAKTMTASRGAGEESTTGATQDVENDETDDNDQVLPAWPSIIDADTLKPSLIQHQVYSLKDYSQVSGPTESVPTSNVMSSGRLLKSMSQDRKVNPQSKRMSESILSGATISGLYSGLMDTKSALDGRQRKPSATSKNSTAKLSTSPANSVNNLLPPNKNFDLAGESRIDRMRKLFVSPLSLRGSANETSCSSTKAARGTGSRLSLQAGANMLNKPQHFMNAMNRTRVAVGGHHGRRSPSRQKQSKMKGFRVYGCPLSIANTMYPITCFGRAEIYKQQSVPYILARLCNYIEENSSQLTHEGIFRVSGNSRLMEKLKTLFDHLGDAPLESESVDVATSASMLKMYLRELPEPLIPTRMNHFFFALAKKHSSYLNKDSSNGSKTSDTINTSGPQEASSISESQSTVDRQRLAYLRDLTKLTRKLPIENYNLLKYLACFLHRVALKQQSNKMSAEALGIVFGPNVFRIRSESYKGLKEQELSNQIMASIISNCKLIFDCELTDPLGNLIPSEESVQIQRQDGGGSSEPKSLTSSQDKGDEHDGRLSHSKNIAVSSPSIPSTSAGPQLQAVEQEQCPRLPRQLRTQAKAGDGFRADSEDIDSDNKDEHDDEDEDEHDDEDDDDVDLDADIDDLDEDEECEDVSYSPTSGSGSYCSSLASDSTESVYEGDVEADQHEDDIAIASTSTSSRCESGTSYTPSSSHLESDEEEEVAVLSSSNFSSSPSPSKALEEQDPGVSSTVPDSVDTIAPIQPLQPSENPCRVCKRRESAQIERLEASRLRNQMAVEEGTSRMSPGVDGASAAVSNEQLNERGAAVPEASAKTKSRLPKRKRRSLVSSRSSARPSRSTGHVNATERITRRMWTLELDGARVRARRPPHSSFPVRRGPADAHRGYQAARQEQDGRADLAEELQ